MAIILAVLETVAPVALLAMTGFLWVRAGFEYRMEFVTRLCMTLAVPALIFTALMKTDIAPKALTAISLAAILAYGALTVIFLATTRLFGLDRRVYMAPLIFGNTGNVGLPLALFAFGQTGLDYAVVVFAVMALWSFTFGIWLVAGGGSILRVLREPAMLATLAGVLFLSQGWHTPRVLTNALDLLAQLAIPLMLLTLGVAVARLAPAQMGRAVWLSLLRAAICTATALAAGIALALPQTALAVLVLQITTPVAVTSYMLAERYDADPNAVAGLVVASTLLSVVTLPLTLGFLV